MCNSILFVRDFLSPWWVTSHSHKVISSKLCSKNGTRNSHEIPIYYVANLSRKRLQNQENWTENGGDQNFTLQRLVDVQ